MFRNYLSIALRLIQKQPGYAFINIVGLAVGMAAFFVITLFISDELSYDKHFENSERIYRVAVHGVTSNGNLNTAMTSPSWGPEWVDEIPEIEALVRMKPPQQMWLVAKDDLKFFEKGFVFIDSTAFDVFSFELTRGTQETALAAPYSVILTESMAAKYFPDSDALGQNLRLDNAYDFTVTGIIRDLPGQSHFKADFLASLSTLRTPIYGDQFLEQNLNMSLYSYALLVPGADPGAVATKIDAYIDRTVGEILKSVGATIRTALQPIQSIHLESHLDSEILPNGSMGTVMALAAIALFILIIACINYMNLATARSASRSREVGIRKVLGAERPQLVRQFLGESFIISMLAMILAVVLVLLILPAFNTAAGKTLTLISSGFLSAVGLFLGVAIVCGLVAGSYPAFFLSSVTPAYALKGGKLGSSGGGMLRKVLVIFQFATSIGLIIATVVVFRQLEFNRNMDLGFDQEQVIIVQLTDVGVRTLYPTFRDRIEELPSVVNISGSSSAPGFFVGTNLVVPEGVSQEETVFAQTFFADFDFIETLGIQIIAGRAHSEAHPSDSLGAFVINESALSEFGWDTDPNLAIGRQISFPGGNFQGEIIGVTENFHAESLHEPIQPALITVANEQSFFYAVIRIQAGSTRDAITEIGRVWQDLYPAYIYQYSFMEDDINELYASDLTLGRLFGGFSFLTILIACLGLFGLASFTAEQRTKEIGVRKVMGASMGQITFLLSKDFARFVAIAFVLIAPIAWIGMNRWLDTFNYRVSFGFGTLLVVGLGVLVISLLTVAFQTVRASLANPVDALKYE
jgi:putative ABC transport system permease protein